MKRISILIAVALLFLAGTVSAYGLYLSCPDKVQVGVPIKCSVDTDFPPGTTFDLVLYQSSYTATQIKTVPVTVQGTNITLYTLMDTTGLPGGQYKIELQFRGTESPKLRSDSIYAKLITLDDRSSEITITSPLSQDLDSALRVEGSISKIGSDGVEVDVKGPDGRIFGPQWIGTKDLLKNGDGQFSQKVTVTSEGDYDVTFKDSKGYIGVKTFHVSVPATPTPAISVSTTAISTITKTPTAIPTPWPTPTKSPLSTSTLLGAIFIAAACLVIISKR
jgi:hypothetical protein